jgi:hypothetical protein
VFLTACFKYCSRGLPTAFFFRILLLQGCLLQIHYCPTHEWRLLSKIFKSNFHLIYIQQDAKLHSLFYLETALHVSGGTSTHHQERIQLYLQHLLFVRLLLLPSSIAASSSNGLTSTRCCKYSCMRS